MKLLPKRRADSTDSQFKIAEQSYAIKKFMESIGDWLAQQREWLVAISILLMAFLIRVWKLASLPVGLHPDEAQHGLDAQLLLRGDLQPFFERSGDAMLSYLQSVSIALMGNTALALRIVPVLIGVVAVWMTYLAARNWFSHRVGVFAALFMATAPWAVQISRLSLSAVLLSLLVPTLIWIIYRAIDTHKAGWYVAAGAIMGLGVYADTIFFMSIIAVIAVLVFAWFNYRERLEELKQPIIIMLLSIAVVLLPLGLYIALETQTYIERDTITNLSEDFGQTISDMPRAAIDTALMLHIEGDSNFLHNLGRQPHLNALTGVMLVLATMLCIRRFRDIRYVSLLAISIAMLTPSILALDEAPNALLAAGAIAPLSILSAIGLSELWMRWRGVFPKNLLARHTAVVAILVILSSAAIYDLQRYFIAWANAPESFAAHREELQTSADYIVENPAEGTSVIALDEPEDFAPIDFLTANSQEVIRISTDEIAGYNFTENDRLIVPIVDGQIEYDFEELEHVESIYSTQRPQVLLLRIYDTDR